MSRILHLSRAFKLVLGVFFLAPRLAIGCHALVDFDGRGAEGGGDVVGVLLIGGGGLEGDSGWQDPEVHVGAMGVRPHSLTLILKLSNLKAHLFKNIHSDFTLSYPPISPSYVWQPILLSSPSFLPSPSPYLIPPSSTLA